MGYIGSGGHATAAVGNCTPDSSWPAERADLESQVLSLVNAHRTGMGLPALQVSSTLTASAVWKARHMAAYDERTHDDEAPPIARAWTDRLAACGYSGPGAGENIAWLYPTAAAVMAGWLGSPDHRANIEAGWTATGIGAAMASNGAVYWAEDFGFPDGGSPPPPTTTTASPPPTTTAAPPPPPATTAPTTTSTSAPAPSSPPPATTTAATVTTEVTTTTTTAIAAVPKAKAALGPRCIVPNVFHLRVAAAKRKVRARGCAVRVRTVKARKLALGKVAWQSPRRRVNMPAGAVVTLAVSAKH